MARRGRGKAAWLRGLVDRALAGETAPIAVSPGGAKPPSDRTVKVRVYLSASDADWIENEAFAMGMHRSSWIAALVHRRATCALRYSREGELAIIRAHTELRRIRSAISQLAGEAGLGATQIDDLPQRLEVLVQEVRGHMGDLRAGFAGNDAYWDGEP